jgi:hypothetical protein
VAPGQPGHGEEIMIGVDDTQPAPAPQVEGVDPAANVAPAAAPPAGQNYADTDPSALTDFHTTLDPYGTWVDDSSYGTVWTPSATVVGADFTPYATAGHWVYDNDYLWVSDYSWGWAPFHYGRWVWIGGRGWSWVPGRVYSGAWVSWRTGYDGWGYVGWAPLPPTWCWRGGYAVGIGVVPPAPYVFVGSPHIFAPVVATHIVNGSNVAVIAGHTRPFVTANPGVGGHVLANPGVAAGPPPQHIGLQPGQIVHAPVNNAGLAQARSFSQPATAASMGGRPPQQVGMARAPALAGTPGVAGNPAPLAAHAPAAPSVSHVTPSLPPSSAHTAVASAPQYRGVAPQAHPAPYIPPASHSIGAVPYMPPRSSSVGTYVAPHSTFAPSAPHYSAPTSIPHYSAPAPHYSAPAPSYHTGGSFSGGHVSSSGGFRGGGHFGGGHHR